MLVWDCEVFGWKHELRDPASERPGAYVVDKAGLVFPYSQRLNNYSARFWRKKLNEALRDIF